MVYPGNYVMRSYDDLDEFYTIIDTEADTSNNTIYVYAEDAGLDLLNDVYGEYTADKASPDILLCQKNTQKQWIRNTH